MKIVSLKCPSCGSTLYPEDGLEIFYCQYCGTKIILDEQSDSAINAKAKIKMQENKLSYKERMKLIEMEENKREFWRFIIPLVLLLLMMIALGLYSDYTSGILK